MYLVLQARCGRHCTGVVDDPDQTPSLSIDCFEKPRNVSFLAYVRLKSDAIPTLFSNLFDDRRGRFNALPKIDTNEVAACCRLQCSRRTNAATCACDQ